MKIRFFLSTLLFLPVIAWGQLAPDFTITDSNGEEHQLYADYLNQGKTVMLKIFFTTCPPCISIAPLMEPFYQEWGAGEYDVEFFELSDKSFDTDALVNAYKAQFNETFIGAGVEGGSLAAVQPYKDGLFGPWFGTPTFVVIAPNGTVNYGVSGAGNQATINALDAAIAATGAMKPGGNTPIAPDFTVTDTDDFTHSLYADYLNQGKTVVLEIYNTTCSGCTSIAPMLQPLYETWGGGDEDVEFITLTDRPADSNPIVFDFQIQHDQTFPCISATGGSLSAVTPYKDGTFGLWTGAPLFVVIAPDGTVAYDVHGDTNTETIDAIDAAIMTTGASYPPSVTLAPDFTITDSHGAQHRLYADYLNQGKSVLLEIFYTTCPPCNSIAPLLEPFYQEWGAGDHDVEFIELSDKNFDTNLLINAYQSQYGETFVAAGKDGGSLAAVSPYKNGSFGPWYGTPTFVVIAPDGSVQYDVDGVNNQATIDALDAALLATGAVKPTMAEVFTIDGNVQFWQGMAGINNAIVQIVDGQGNIVMADTTGFAGTFQFSGLLQDVRADWRIKAIKTGNPKNGVSSLDLVRIQKHLLGIEHFTNEWPKIAGDANGSSSLSALDLVTISKVLLGIIPNFPGDKSWTFLPADIEFGEPGQSPPVVVNAELFVSAILNGEREAQLIGIKTGDATGNANPAQ